MASCGTAAWWTASSVDEIEYTIGVDYAAGEGPDDPELWAAIMKITATYGTGPEDECVACSRMTFRWVHAMISYPLCPLCMSQAQREEAARER